MADPQNTEWLGVQRIDGKVVARIGRRGEHLVADFPHAGELVASSDGEQVKFEAASAANSELVKKLGASTIRALVRHLNGKLTFHGGAVASGTHAVAFIGPSGAGKSTLAAALCMERGLDLVADDTVAVELPEGGETGTVQILPTQDVAWLLPQARSALGLEAVQPGKRSISLARSAEQWHRLDAIVGLVFDPSSTSPTLQRLRGQEAFSILSQSAIRFVLDKPAVQLREFEQLERLVLNCPVFVLRRPRELGELSRSAELAAQLLVQDATKGGRA